MSKSNRNASVVKTALALAVLALPGAAFAQQSSDNAYSSQARSTQQKAPATDVRKMATTFGVSELNDIENWKITHNGTELGEIDRIATDRATGELLAVVGIDGVVGVNMKEVAIPLANLKKAGEETLSTDMTLEQLQMKRDIDPWDGTYTQTVDEGAEH